MNQVKIVACFIAVVCLSSFSSFGSLTYDSLLNNKNLSSEEKAKKLLEVMTLEEKIGQMTQVNKKTIEQNPNDIEKFFIGSILSGGGDAPAINNPTEWKNVVTQFQDQALRTEKQIPLLYGIDAVHGHGNAFGATLFPHNIGLGATRDESLVKKIGEITALEVAATGIHWNFAPAVSIAHDVRWGRTYESFGEKTELVTKLANAYLIGLQKGIKSSHFPTILGSVKHFIGDGGTKWKTSTNKDFIIDQGDTQLSEEILMERHLPPYVKAIESGALNIMVSYSSWNGLKMHAHKYLLTDILKGKLGFNGFLISDWMAINQLPGSKEDQIVASINAGLDMIMVPDQYQEFIDNFKSAFKKKRITLERIDDAVYRILRVKFIMNLGLEKSLDIPKMGNNNHRNVAREAVRKSLVLLKNEGILPLSKSINSVLVAGKAASDIGRQCGGWTLEWQGVTNKHIPGTSFLKAIKNVLPNPKVRYLENIKSDQVLQSSQEDLCIAVIGEPPYTEGFGDNGQLFLPWEDIDLVSKLRKRCSKLITILYSGRPMLIEDELKKSDAFIAAWLPGSEGAGITDVLFGDYNFTGKLPFTWQKNMNGYLGFPVTPENILFPYGYGKTMN